MNPSRLFILRPVATCLLMLAVLLTGLLAYRLLPQAALPQVDYPTIQVLTRYTGANPDVIASTVTAPLERQLGAIAGLKQMSSSSSGGLSVIILQFDLELSMDVAVQSVQAAINAAAGYLPSDLPTPPIYSKVNPADAPVLTLAISSEVLPLTKVQDLVDTRLVQKLSQVSGVGLVSLGGGQRPAVHIAANPQALAAYGIGLEQIRSAITAASSSQAKGGFDGAQLAYALEANSQLRTVEDYQQLIIDTRNGAVLHLRDVATISESPENPALGAWANQQPAILVNIQRQPDANVLAVVDNIRQLLPALQASLPASVHVNILTDRTTTIRHSIDEARFELLLAIALVVMVILLFLRSVAATFISGLAVPLSLIGTFSVMYLAGFSVNNLTLMALTIATGFVVDDAIVMIENISRHIEEGQTRLQAALTGAKEIGFTIIALTFSLIAVLIPLLFMGDVVGRLFREFAITLAVAILISAIVSLTLTPMLCARLLKEKTITSKEPKKQGFFDRVSAVYGRLLTVVLRHQGKALLVVLASLATTIVLVIAIPKGFFPQQDTGVIQGITQASSSVSFAAMSAKQQQLSEIISQDPAVDSVSSVVGVDGVNTTLNSGQLLINLKQRPAWQESIAEVSHRLQLAVEQVADIKLYLQPVQDLTVDKQLTPSQYQYVLASPDSDALSQAQSRLVAKMQSLPQLKDVVSNVQNNGLQAYIEVNRDTAARLGVNLAAIDEALYNAFGQRAIATIFTPTSQYRVVLTTDNQGLGVAALSSLYVTSVSGQQVPLSSFARISERSAPLSISRERQFPAATISFNLADGYALGDAVNAINQASASLALPASIEGRFQGAALAFSDALRNELWLVLAAILTMYIVLGMLYENFIHPLTILSTLPSAGVGALLALFITHNDLNIIAIIGIILLMGIVQKNAIMMIDFALVAQRQQQLSPQQAIYQASLLRLRPILMTTLAALFSAIPLVWSAGAGSELRQPLGIVMIGGLLVSQLLTLFTTPVVYLAFDRLQQRLTKAHVTKPNVKEKMETEDSLAGESL